MKSNGPGASLKDMSYMSNIPNVSPSITREIKAPNSQIFVAPSPLLNQGKKNKISIFTNFLTHHKNNKIFVTEYKPTRESKPYSSHGSTYRTYVPKQSLVNSSSTNPTNPPTNNMLSTPNSFQSSKSAPRLKYEFFFFFFDLSIDCFSGSKRIRPASKDLHFRASETPT